MMISAKKLIRGMAIEHKGTNNRLLRELGWIQVQGNRPSPLNDECRLVSEEELYKLRKSLVSAMKNADIFISKVFRSSDKVWVARCDSIIRG